MQKPCKTAAEPVCDSD